MVISAAFWAGVVVGGVVVAWYFHLRARHAASHPPASAMPAEVARSCASKYREAATFIMDDAAEQAVHGLFQTAKDREDEARKLFAMAEALETEVGSRTLEELKDDVRAGHLSVVKDP